MKYGYEHHATRGHPTSVLLFIFRIKNNTNTTAVRFCEVTVVLAPLLTTYYLASSLNNFTFYLSPLHLHSRKHSDCVK